MLSLLPLWYSLITALFMATFGNAYQVQETFIHSGKCMIQPTDATLLIVYS